MGNNLSLRKVNIHTMQLKDCVSYLFITFLGCGILFEVQTSEDDILAETFSPLKFPYE